MGLGFGFFTLGNCLTRPGYTSVITNTVPTEFTARAVSMTTIAASIAGLFSPIASTELLSKTNHETLHRCASGVLLMQLVLVVVFLRGDDAEEVLVDTNATKANEGEYQEVGAGPMTEEQFVQELATVLKHRNYNLRCPRSQKIIMEITTRSFPYLTCGEYDEECKKLLDELKISECEETKCKIRRGSIARRASCRLAAAQLTQLGE
mmetsp:Transcript_5211/g.9562  ORF Transcript_5211/g.9562 Transcript_5211/m.9562 type:complete len:207 (+) Transcript_5211:2-622(+)